MNEQPPEIPLSPFKKWGVGDSRTMLAIENFETEQKFSLPKVLMIITHFRIEPKCFLRAKSHIF